MPEESDPACARIWDYGTPTEALITKDGIFRQYPCARCDGTGKSPLPHLANNDVGCSACGGTGHVDTPNDNPLGCLAPLEQDCADEVAAAQGADWMQYVEVLPPPPPVLPIGYEHAVDHSLPNVGASYGGAGLVAGPNGGWATWTTADGRVVIRTPKENVTHSAPDDPIIHVTWRIDSSGFYTGVHGVGKSGTTYTWPV